VLRIGITGQSGFIGSHLYNYLGLKENIKRIQFEDDYFKDNAKLDYFTKKCDVIVHLAALNRHENEKIIYSTNIRLVQQLIESTQRTDTFPHIIMASSTQENRNNLYGKSKVEGREKFIEWSKKNECKFTGLVIPNVFGPFCEPFYNSVVSTFSYQIIHNKHPKVHVDAPMELIDIQDLVELLYHIAINEKVSNKYLVQSTGCFTVKQILDKLINFDYLYNRNNILPDVSNYFDLCLFNTYRSYFDKEFFPKEFGLHSDSRGLFAEIIKSEGKGQISFSTTKPGITRGNHFHIRKIERFCVVQGEALIQLRRIGTAEVINYKLSGNEPAYIDMPVWYTHNLINVGQNELVTLFWINDFFDSDNPDTFFEEVQIES
jgi:UDP-2-acetamido-2,6-beta-L-arabino-hexul-4-ose reductase